MKDFTLPVISNSGSNATENSKGNTRFWSFLFCMCFAILFLFPNSTFAQHPYEFVDQNVRVDETGGIDWETVWIAQQTENYGLLPEGSITTNILFDASAPDTIYFGGNTKDHLPLSGWDWQTSNSSSSDKTNILESGAILIGNHIYFFGNKFASEGTTTFGFWFFQDEVSTDPSGGFTGEHSIGDILIVADVEQGGAVGYIRAYKYVGEGNGDLPNSNKTFIEFDLSEGENGELYGVVNTLEQPTPWPHQSKNYPPDMMPPITFFEGFIDIASLGLANPCFSSFLMETRSSNPINAALEDFNLGGFNVTPSVSLDDLALCEDELPATLTATVNGGIGDIKYEWRKDGGDIIPGEDSASLEIDDIEDAGSYSVVAIGEGTGGVGECRSESATADVDIYPLVVVSAGDDQSVCSDDPEVTLAGSISGGATTGVWSGGTGTFDPNANALDAVYTPSQSEIEAGTVTLTLTSIDPDGPCEAEDDEMVVTIFATPSLDPIGAVTACDSYGLPAVGEVSGDNLYSPKYYDDSQANEGEVITDLTLTESQMVWVYDESGTDPNCFDEISFMVTINDTPVLDPIGDVTECDEYTLPAASTLTGSNLVDPQYYDDSQANNGQLITDLTLTESQTVWVYDETGTDPNCFDEISFVVTINDTPVLDPIGDVTECDEYTLPAVSTLTGSNLVDPQYYDDSQANDGELITDLTLNASQTVWVYDETGTDPNCSDEISFMVIINNTPVLDPIGDVTECDEYTLPAISTLTGSNLVDPQYYDDSQANNGALITDLTLTDSQIVWVYDETGTEPNCSDEISFDVVITDSPIADDLSDVTACDEYILPGLSSGNQYFTGTGGTGDELFAGDAITSSQDIYIYAAASEPCIADENMFTVTIYDSPVADDFADVVRCDAYTLPALSEGSQYFTGTDGSGTELFAGASITKSQTIYVYAEATEPCVADETSFMVTINYTPVLDPIADVTECDSYTLPAPSMITGTNLVNPQYYDDSQANNGQLITNLTLTESQMIWVYDETGTDPNCFDEISFMVTIEICAQEGCTLGFWKNHTDQWECYSTCTPYGSIFNDPSGTLSGMTLLDVLNLGGGGIYNLGRQSVAALLNACSGIDYYFSDTGEVIAYVNAALASGNYEFAGNELDMYNQAGCPLGGRATTAPSESCNSVSSSSSFDASAGISLSPVPFKDKLNVKYDFDYVSDATIQIFDMRGNLVKTQKESNAGKGKVTEINADFVRGEQMYIVKVTTNQGTYTKSAVSRKQ